jgi:RNA polymerase sigma factor (TIGR02999 family)
MSSLKTETTRLLASLSQGDSAAVQRLTPILYEELHLIAERILQRERPNHTLQATALVNEAYLRLVDQDEASLQDRVQFLALGATMMRRILVDYSRAAGRLKRGGDRKPVTLHEASALADAAEVGILDIDDALKDLEQLDARQARLVELRFFGGASVPEIAVALSVSERTVNDDWRMARAWLRRRLDPEGGAPSD